MQYPRPMLGLRRGGQVRHFAAHSDFTVRSGSRAYADGGKFNQEEGRKAPSFIVAYGDKNKYTLRLRTIRRWHILGDMSGVVYTPLANIERKRHQRYKRPETLRPMRETERDQQIVRLIFDYRLLSQRQLERLLGKSRSTVQQSLIRLYHHQYLERLFMPISRFGSSPTIYTLGKRGFELLRRAGVHNFAGVPSKYPSSFFLAHTLAINEVRLAMTQAAQQHLWSIAEWQTENEIKSDYDRVPVLVNLFKPQKLAVLPDSYFVINSSEEGQNSYFLEVDRGTMPLKRFTTKIAAYVAYYKHGGYTRRFKTKGFRVLTVVEGVGMGRVHGLLDSSAGVKGIGRRFWFAHIDEVTKYNPLTDPIWHIAGTEEKVALYDF